MALKDKKITADMLKDKGVLELQRFPELKDGKMQAKFDELVRDVVVPAFNDVVEDIDKDYATKQYVADAIYKSGGEGGDTDASVMLTDIYDSEKTGVVNAAANGITDCEHQKEGTTHNITRVSRGGYFGFFATADCNAGDKFKVDGADINVNGSETNTLDGLFKAGDWVEAIYDGGVDLKIGTKIDTKGGAFAGEVRSITAPAESVAAFRNIVVVAADADISALDVPVGTIVLQKKG